MKATAGKLSPEQTWWHAPKHSGWHQLQKPIGSCRISAVPAFGCNVFAQMRRNLQKNSGNVKKQNGFTSPRDHSGATAVDYNHKEIAKITEMEFRIWMSNKISGTEKKVENQQKELKKYFRKLMKRSLKCQTT